MPRRIRIIVGRDFSHGFAGTNEVLACCCDHDVRRVEFEKGLHPSRGIDGHHSGRSTGWDTADRVVAIHYCKRSMTGDIEALGLVPCRQRP